MAAWQLSGTYFEACNCDVACPCIFLSPPTQGHCNVLVGWHIDSGNDQATRLDGLNVVLAAHAPGHMAQGKWRVAVYVDERASQPQRDALLRIFGGQAGGHPGMLASFIGEVTGAHFTRIDFSSGAQGCALKIPNVAEAEIVPLEGQGKGAVTVSGHPLCVAPGYPATIAKSKQVSYSGPAGMSWSERDKTGMFSPFAYQA
jgi:hypothetical protein